MQHQTLPVNRKIGSKFEFKKKYNVYRNRSKIKPHSSWVWWQNKEIEEVFNEPEFMLKIVSIERIQSISEKYILVKSSHGRIMYWEYKGTMEELKQKLLSIDIKIA